MDANRWEQIQEIYLEVVELSGSERDAVLRDRCGDDAELRAEVESLLPFETEGGTLLDASLNDLALLLGAADSADDGEGETDDQLPDRIGPYQVTGLLGRGGMGLVYRAERNDDQYERTVALKLVRGGATDPEARARFRREQRILASLEHRGIARLYDAGVSDDGLPWLAMELVEGESIHHWCDQRALGVAERLRLFEDVCEAVEYAHRNLVIHRDLKPSNILVTAEGQVKLLDFGIARLVETDDDRDDPLTRVGQRILTPGYSSPEQLRGDHLTTASDVFTLGVVLHRLLTGVVPDRSDGDREVTRPSAVLGSAPEDWPAWESTERLKKDLAGDLDTLVMKALRVEPGERYSSVADLREDLVRWRERRPLQARPQTLGYRASRFVRRNRGAVAGSTVVALVMATSAVALVRAEGRAEAAAAQAEVEAQTATRVSDFLVELLGNSSPEVAQGDEVTVRQVLDQAAARLDTALVEEPLVKSRLLHQVGTTYFQLGYYDDAAGLFRRGLALHDSLPGLAWDRRFHLLNGLFQVLEQVGEYDEAEAVLLEAGRLEEENGGSVEMRSTVTSNLGMLYANIGRLDEAEDLIRENLALERARMVGDTSRDVGIALNNLALVLSGLGRTDESLDLFRESLDLRRRTLGERHPEFANALTNMGVLLGNLGQFNEGEPYLREAVAINRQLYGVEHAIVANDIQALAFNLQGQGRLEEALPLADSSLAMRLRLLGPDNPGVGLSYATLSQIALGMGDTLRAFEHSDASYQTFIRAYGAEHEYSATLAIRSARLLMQALGDTASAVQRWERGLQWYYDVQGADGPSTAAIAEQLADVFTDWGRPAEAARILEEYRPPQG